jgi:hypothetical protein
VAGFLQGFFVHALHDPSLHDFPFLVLSSAAGKGIRGMGMPSTAVGSSLVIIAPPM